MKFLFFYFVSCIVLLNVVDGLTTYRILSAGGQEMNPIMDWFIQIFGILDGLVLGKIVFLIPLIIWCVFVWIDRCKIKDFDILLVFLIFLFYSFMMFFVNIPIYTLTL